MVDGLVLSKEKSLFEEFYISFPGNLTSFEYADSVESAKNAIDLLIPDYLIIIEKSVTAIQEMINNLFENETIKNIPVICFIAAEDWSQRNKLWQLGVKDIVQLPISREELNLQFETFITDITDITFDQEEAGMQGKLEDYNLLDLIQTIENNKKTGILVLYHARDEGKIWFEEGNIHDVKLRTFNPVQAIQKMVVWRDGDFSILFVDEKYEKMLEQNNQQILLDAIQHIDKRNKIVQSLPDMNETLLISPDADMDLMDEEEVMYLRFFHGGQKISSYLDAFDMDDITLLELLHKFIDNKLLMTKEVFDNFITEQEIESGNTGIKKVFKKFFSKNEETEIKKKKSTSADRTDELLSDEELIKMDDDSTFINLYRIDQANLDKIKKFLKKI